MKIKLLIIAGPTCVGKSALAIDCAKKFNGEIISCDSMQIYRGCDIVTAKITKQEMQGVPHYMIDVVDAKSDFSVSEFKDMAERIIEDIFNRGKLPILVGGTGLYIDAIIKDFDFKNVAKDEKVRAKYERYLEEFGSTALYDFLKQKDSALASKINKNNTVRVIRALEAIDGGYLSNSQKSVKDDKYDYLYCVLNKDRNELYNDINNRVDKMISNGALEEVEKLLNSGVTFNNQCMKSIGYKEWEPYLNGKATIDEVANKIKQNTRNYAKRQLTWFRHRENAKFYDINETKFYSKLIKDIDMWL